MIEVIGTPCSTATRSVREIGQAVGLSSTSLARHLTALGLKGFLRYEPASQP
ncbi:hypothetical protein ACIP29_36980 [Streptomyces coelicoflavus]|uniref:LexA family protein n=1 Tax=Streptomyces coelicoflavus TaxID=285562 RepID=UPI0038064567